MLTGIYIYTDIRKAKYIYEIAAYFDVNYAYHFLPKAVKNLKLVANETDGVVLTRLGLYFDWLVDRHRLCL